MTNEARTRCVQIADEKLVFNVLDGGNNYPGFQSLVNEALNFVELYEQTYDCGAPHSAILHYKDIVRISVPESLTIDLEEYFTIIRDLRLNRLETPGPLQAIFRRFVQTDSLPLTINVSHLPPADGEFRFQLDWEKACKPGDFSDRDLLRRSLSETSEFMVECFEESITTKTRELFEPLPKRVEMPFAIDKNPPAIHAEFAVSREERVSRQRVVFDAYEMPIRSISAGTGDYPLRASLIAYYYPSIGELHVEQVSPTFVGKARQRRGLG